MGALFVWKSARASAVRAARASAAGLMLLAPTVGLAHAATSGGMPPQRGPQAATLKVATAQPFTANGSAVDHARAVRCLTYAIYYEAGNQSPSGQQAVAQVVLNRVRNPAFPRTVCGVVFQGAHSKTCQFTFACDGSIGRPPEAAAWRRAEGVAEDALRGSVMAQVGVATYYHADYVFPNWSSLSRTTQVGAHIFFTRPGDQARIAGQYAGGEPLIDVRALMPSAAVPPPDLVDLLDVEPLAPEEPHSADDVGGRVQVGHGWTPTAAAPTDDAMARILAAQGNQ